MNVLAIETSSSACSTALFSKNKITFFHEINPLKQAALILPQIQTLLTNEALSPKDLNAIAFGRGPGSFTGLRIATSVAQGLGYALDIPLLPVSSLATLAQTAYRKLGCKKMLVAMDARIQEVYWAFYVINQSGLAELVDEEKLSAPSELFLPDKDCYCIGNAWSQYEHEIPFLPTHKAPTLLPEAQSLIPLALSKYHKKEWKEAGQVTPIYLRDKVAMKSRTR